MIILFCSDPFSGRRPDPVYEAEVEAARAAGFDTALVSFEEVVAGRADVSVRYVPRQEEQLYALYRGWMLKPQQYRAMYDSLIERGLKLVNTPDEYLHCHYLPESYPEIKGHTPATAWMPLSPGEPVDFKSVMALLNRLGAPSVVLKDYVKSQKHYWTEACFIPDTTDRTHVEMVVKRFLALQGDDLSGGLVFREFVRLATLSSPAAGGMPIPEEYRIFFFQGSPLYVAEYWEQGKYPAGGPPVQEFLEVAGGIKSHFFTMDVARQANRGWMIVELGDGQVAGLPEHSAPIDFYTVLADHLSPKS